MHNLNVTSILICFSFLYRASILAAQATLLLKYGSLCTYQIGGNIQIKLEYESLEASMGVHEQSLQKYSSTHLFCPLLTLISPPLLFKFAATSSSEASRRLCLLSCLFPSS